MQLDLEVDIPSDVYLPTALTCSGAEQSGGGLHMAESELGGDATMPLRIRIG